MWQGAMCGGGHVWQGSCMAVGHVWQGGVHGRGMCMAGGHAWQERRPLQRTVCILLECILVGHIFDILAHDLLYGYYVSGLGHRFY